MTGATRRDIAASGLGFGRVTAIAGRVCVKSRRDRKRHAAARGTMAGGATDTSHFEVQRMIELHPKTLQSRKRFQRAGLYIGMTDGADRAAGIRELLCVTAGAGQVPGSARTSWHRCVSVSAMTEQTGETRMIPGA